MDGVECTVCCVVCKVYRHWLTARLTAHAQNYDDEDLQETLEWLSDWLAHNIHQMSSWDRYKKELLAGRLEWSPMHSSVRVHG